MTVVSEYLGLLKRLYPDWVIYATHDGHTGRWRIFINGSDGDISLSEVQMEDASINFRNFLSAEGNRK